MKYILYITLFSILFSCNTEKRTFVITFDNANGLVVGNPVVINDYQIGEVKKMSLSKDYKINAEIILSDTIRLPKDSKFTIGSKDLFTKAIIVTPGTSKYYLLPSDKIIGQQAQSLKLDTIINVITNEINNSKPAKNQDSIISELHKMNVQIEEIKKK
jgi:ABC-type transporter Mla subunit MlaD